jgi:hypothetical protein
LKEEKTMAIGGMFDKAKESASKAKSGALSKLGELQEVGAEKINESLKQFNAARPYLKKAGYALSELEIELGLPPKVTSHFQHTDVDQADVEQAFVELEGNALGTSVLTLLVKAAELQSKIQVYEMSFAYIEVEVGIVPTVTLKYVSE